jgi:hypothetical protein
MKSPSTAFGGPQMQGRRFGDRASLFAGLAARVLGWGPDEFWRATPAELVGALAAPTPANGMMSDEIERLKEQFPDG